MTLISITLFGAAGVFFRYILSLLLTSSTMNIGAWSTFLINVLGSLAIGFLAASPSVQSGWPEALRTGCIVGFLGGFTTFSTFSLDIFKFINETKNLQALLYSCLSVILSLLAVYAGAAIARR